MVMEVEWERSDNTIGKCEMWGESGGLILL